MTPAKTNTRRNLLPALLSDFFEGERFPAASWLDRAFEESLPPVNIRENEKSFDIECAVPGFKKDQMKVNVENNLLTISAEQEEEKNTEDERYTRREFSSKAFVRSFTLPENVHSDKIDASYTNGILTLNIPKLKEQKSQPKKEIKIS